MTDYKEKAKEIVGHHQEMLGRKGANEIVHPRKLETAIAHALHQEAERVRKEVENMMLEVAYYWVENYIGTRDADDMKKYVETRLRSLTREGEGQQK